ncbi:MAG: LptF/LptG family permease, partial [Muribaculaceae bacterium]|nr:LptF/LptG family permease [Muribaculaceae bacterium]
FVICLFIVLMQFLWRYIDDLVGKGLSVDVIGELFFYAALTMVPMALPLAILLASLMTFGNLGERFELTAMKASGVSLLKVMKPLIVFIVLVAIGAFFFQNNVLPIAQTKMWTLLYSVRQKSPELEIPEGVFYDQIPGFNFYVGHKDRETGKLYDIMIYDVSRGFENVRVILADSGNLKMADDKEHLFLRLHSGQQFENLRETAFSGIGAYQPYRRENFDLKEILLKFDAGFNRMDESGMRNQYVGKNITELQATIDSVGLRVDSIGNVYARDIKEAPYMRVAYYKTVTDSSGHVTRQPRSAAMPVSPADVDSLMYKASPAQTASYIVQAISKIQRVKQEYEFKSYMMEDDRFTIRRHGIELQRKFTLSFACLVFFFIGAPLGAIIRKGGLGTPLVISVFLFIVYYIIDNSGYKMARDGKLTVVEGIWLSSAVLLPLGIFFTYKAMRDSAVFNIDAYRLWWMRVRGRLRRELEVKEFVMHEIDPARGVALAETLSHAAMALKSGYDSMPLPKRIYFYIRRYPPRDSAQAAMNDLVEYLADSRSRRVIALVNRLPFQVTSRNAQTVAETASAIKTELEAGG